MKKYCLLLFFAVILIAIVVSNITFQQVSAHSAGADWGYCGDPFGGNITCANGGSCHASQNTLPMGKDLITSNTPSSGYTPGATYSFTATVTRAGHIRYGFEVSPQNAGGYMLGTLIVTSSANTQLTTYQGVSYITHTSAGTLGTVGYHTWNFNWKAPAKGSGTVTFYGAFNITNDDGTSSGDTCQTDTLTVKENVGAGINQLTAPSTRGLSVYPNPAKEFINLDYTLTQSSRVEVNMYSLDGKKVSSFLAGSFQNEGEHKQQLSIPADTKPGIYIIQLLTDGQSAIQRIMVE